MSEDEKIKKAIREAFRHFGLSPAWELVDEIAERVIAAQRGGQ